MDKIVTIKHGDFEAVINLAEVDRLTLEQWRKLARLAADNLWDNAQAVQDAIDFLKEAVFEADQAWKDASRAYVNLYREPGFIPPGREKRAAIAENKRLVAAVKSAKHRMELWLKRLAAITDHVPPDQLNYCLRAQK